MRYDRNALCDCIYLLHQRNEHVGNGYYDQILQRLDNMEEQLSLNQLLLVTIRKAFNVLNQIINLDPHGLTCKLGFNVA